MREILGGWMKMEPYKDLITENWCIKFNDYRPTDQSMAEMLDMDLDTYIEIITGYGAFKPSYIEYWFKTREEVEKAIEGLEPFYIMQKLTEK